MKTKLLCLFMALWFSGCNRQPETTQKQLEARIDSLQKMIDKGYRPGLGEFMTGIQLHHEKLWFAGKNQNWELADFEINEIREALTDINAYCSDRPEVHFLPMLNSPLDSLGNSIRDKNSSSFQKNYITLTNTCNSCHQTTHHGFNVIKLPDSSPFSDQDFSGHASVPK